MTEGMVWVVDDDRSIRFVLRKALERAGIPSRAFERAEDVLEALREERPDVLVSDIRMPGMDGTSLLEEVKRRQPTLPVIIMTAYSDVESAVASFKGGAFEYLAKPFDVVKAVEVIDRARKASAERSSTVGTKVVHDPFALIGQAESMQEIFRAIGRLSQSSVTVLITGESGTGKEVVARSIWQHSPRKNAPYVAVNMAAIPKELLESELFGHEKGAFTGALARREGRFGEARGGTLFLDEIGDMPMELQTRLLRVLSSGTYYRVGGHEPIRADVRVIAATNQALERRVKEGLFREDLYHRLNVIRLRLPPLRCRVADIGPLARYFLKERAAELGVEEKTLSDEALAVLEKFPFPGNVRQLENVCRWLLVMAPSKLIRPEDLPEEVREGEVFSPVLEEAGEPEEKGVDWRSGLRREIRDALRSGESHPYDRLVTEVEQMLFRAALEHTRGRRGEAATLLGIGRNTLTRKLQIER
ncbi:MAG TPA: nitrogen regulation protein NR(I) [Candidatus Sutterella merdavium]|jgi:two-component system nitrogen regulation response regulator GlnG|nr:nitrogen regulation protein NR(I) [Candidatus Sutterella merdavium]